MASWAVLSLYPSVRATSEAKQSPEVRWGKEIRAFEEADQTNPPPREAILFIGSSSIRRWTNLAQAFPGHKVISRGFTRAALSTCGRAKSKFLSVWEAMADFCCAWCQKAIASGIDQLVSMAQSLTDHAAGLLSCTVTQMSNGRMEGINRKIKMMLRQFYGLGDNDFLRLKLYALHESKHKLVG